MANRFKHRHQRTLQTELETLTSNVLELTGDGAIPLNPTIPASSTNFLVDIAFLIANVKSIWISCDKAVTIKTNDSGTPQETIAVAAGVPIVWDETMDPADNPFSGDITKFYVTNANTGTGAEMVIRILLDSTPSTP